MNSIVYIVDDDQNMRNALGQLLEAEGLHAKTYADGEEMLRDAQCLQRGCVLMDVRLPRMNGLQIQRALSERQIDLPVIFLTAHADVPTAVEALRAGAFDFLEKPIDGARLLACIRNALDGELQRRLAETERRRLAARSDTLTAREQAVMNLVVRGHSNKEIGGRLSISHRTVEVHRKRVMQKMRAPSLLALVSFAQALGLPTRDPDAVESAHRAIDPEDASRAAISLLR